MSENKDTRTASQRIEDLEKVVTVVYQTAAQTQQATQGLPRLQEDMSIVKETIRLLNKKLEAVIQVAAPETGITTASVSAVVTKMTIDELKAQVAGYLAGGLIIPAETVQSDGYVVAEELNSDGTLANSRVQFRMDNQDKATLDGLKDKKAGDVVSFGENRFDIRIQEVYTLIDPKKAQEAAAAAAKAAADAAAADAASASSEASTPTETTPAAEATPALAPLPAESPVGFDISIHGSAESSLTSPATTTETQTAAS